MVLSTQRPSAAAPLALALALAQLGVASLLTEVPTGTRALGAGASVTTALLLCAGYLLGRTAPDRPGRGRSIPWPSVAMTALFLAIFGLLGWGLGLAEAVGPAEWVGPGRAGRSMLATDAVAFPAVVLLAMGALLGTRSRRGAVLFGFVGAAALLGSTWAGYQVVRHIVLEPAAIGSWTVTVGALATLAVGFGLAWARSSVAFVEMAITALVCGYTLYLGVALGPPALVGRWTLPIEQVLLALSIVPSIALMALLSVGGSLGYLLFGSGRFDPRFGYETRVALRYLQVNLQGASGRILIGLFLLAFCVQAGLWAYLSRGPTDGVAGALAVWAVGLPAWALALGHRRKGAVLLPLAGAALAAWLLIGALAAVASLLALTVAALVPWRRKSGSAQKPPFVGVVTVISVVGVAMGVLALIVVLSVMSGFEEDLRSKILGAHAHVVVEKYGDDFEEYADVEAKVRTAPGVRTAAAFVTGDAMMSTDVGLSGTLVKGIDPASDDAVAELRKNLERGRVAYLLTPEKIPGACGRRIFPTRPKPPPGHTSTGAAGAFELDRLALGGAAECSGRILPGVIIGKELSRTLRAYVGDVVKLVSPVSDEIGPLGPTPKLRRYRVAGIFYSGMFEYDAKLAYVSMQRAQKFFGKRGRASGVELKIEDIDASGTVVSDLELRLGGKPYRVKDWRDMNKELFSALLLEKIAMFVALTMIIAVASFLIVATLVMIVLQRGREIAILKSIGASEASIMKIFVVQGVVVGVGGAVLGVLLGVDICQILRDIGLPLDERIFYIEQLPVVLDPFQVRLISISAIVITYLATIYPALTAAVLEPVDGLREE